MNADTRETFRAMGTGVVVITPSTADPYERTKALSRIRSVFSSEERRFSRFRGNSELASVNAAAGRWTTISPGFERLVRFALDHAERTAGLFDPTALDAVVAAGYDRDFDEVLAGARGALHPPRPCGRWAEIEVRPGALRLPAGVGLDLGGVAKGWTVDLAIDAALQTGLSWAFVSAGGDLRIAGDTPGIDVAIEDPLDADTEVVRVRLGHGALASSSITKRAWGPGLHHVIDPRTGIPSDTCTLQATVWAPTCAEAEVWATWALLTGPFALETVSGAIATADGELRTNFFAVEAA